MINSYQLKSVSEKGKKNFLAPKLAALLQMYVIIEIISDEKFSLNQNAHE
jgi:hypothetical protein